MRKAIYLVLMMASLVAIGSCSREREIVSLTTKHLSLGISSKGCITSMRDLKSGTDYKAINELSPLMALYTDHGDSIEYLPEQAFYDETSGILTMDYPNGSVARIKIDNKQEYLRFELLSVEPRYDIRLVVWGPFCTSIGETVGETVGVVRNTDFAIGAQALDIKTLGGIPDNFSNLPSGYIIDPLPGQIVPDSLTNLIGKPCIGDVFKLTMLL
jgi:hypothetical protein